MDLQARRGKDWAQAQVSSDQRQNWIASLKACSSQDGWLQMLMSLLLEAHGETWKRDRYMGKLATAGGQSSPKTVVNLAKTALERYAKEGIDAGLKEEDIATLRC